MKKINKIITVIIVLAAMAALAKVAEILFQTSGQSEFQLIRDTDGQKKVLKTAQDYELYRDFTGAGTQMYLLDKRITTQYPLDADGVWGSAHWSIRSGENLETKLWERTEDVSLLEVDHLWGLVVSGKTGCCAEMTGYRAFDIKTGHLILSYNDFTFQSQTPFVLSIPNSKLVPRFVGVISMDSTRDTDFVEPELGLNNGVLVKYATTTGVYQKLQIDLEREQGWAVSVLDVELEADPSVPDSDKIEIRDGVATLWNIDKAVSASQIQGVKLKVVLNAGQGDKVIKVPVFGDRFEIISAEMPPGVQIRQLQ